MGYPAITKARQDAFILALKGTGQLVLAASESGVSDSGILKLRTRNKAFRLRCVYAKMAFQRTLDALLHKCARCTILCNNEGRPAEMAMPCPISGCPYEPSNHRREP